MAIDRPLTAKQAAFARAYISNGRVGVDAYRAAYDTQCSAATASRRAIELLQDSRIAALVDKARKAEEQAASKALAEVTLTKADMVRKLSSLFVKAVDAEDLRGAARVSEVIAKVCGWVTERRDIRFIRSLSDLSDEELTALEEDARQQGRIR